MPAVDFNHLFFIANNLRNNAQVDEAISAYKEIIELATQPDELAYQAKAWHLAGVSAKENVLEEGSYYRDAQRYFDQAEQLFKQLGDTESVGAVYRDRGIIADYAHKTDEAELWFRKSLELLSTLKSPSELGITQAKFGLHYYQIGKYLDAVNYIEAGLKILDSEPSAGFFHATALYDLARSLFKLGRVDLALEQAQLSLSWFEADHGGNEHQRRVAQIHGLLSLIYIRQDKVGEAKHHGQLFWKLIKGFDALAARVLQRDLEKLAE